MLLKAKNILRKRAPWILIRGNRLAARTILFRKERKYLDGRLENGCGEKSVLLFTGIRCGSQYLSRVIASLYEEAGGDFVNLPNYFFHVSPERNKELRRAGEAEALLRKRGFFFGALRPILGGFPFGDYCKIVCVRDPRDVMVSGFYSLAYAHTPSDEKFARDSEEARERGIEWYVRQPVRYESIREHYGHYRKELLPRKDVLFFRYEEMRDCFPEVLGRVARHIGVDPGASRSFRALLAEHRAGNPQESPEEGEGRRLRHRRSGRSGQFREKLGAEAQGFLGEVFREDLEAFGWE